MHDTSTHTRIALAVDRIAGVYTADTTKVREGLTRLLVETCGAEAQEVLRDLHAALARQPHVAPCLLYYGPERHPGASCSCWLAHAIDFVEARRQGL